MCSVIETNLIDVILHIPGDNGDVNNYASEVKIILNSWFSLIHLHLLEIQAILATNMG